MSALSARSSVERSAPATRWWFPSAAGLVIVLAGALAYHNSLGGPFIFDDPRSIRDNPTIRSLWPIWPLLSPPAEGLAIQSRPVINISLAINYAIGGLDVRGYHIFNLVVHILAALTLFGIIQRTLHLAVMPEHIARSSLPLAFVAALIWAVHPLQTEAVTYIIQRTESLMGLFYLLTLYCMIRGAGAVRPFWWYVAAVVACTLGMGSKEVMVTAPLIVLLYDRVFLARSLKQVFRHRWPLYIGLAATWVLLAALVIPPGGRGSSVGFGYWAALRAYIPGQAIVVVRYLRLSFWPSPLIIDYGIFRTGSAAQVLPYAVILVLLLVGTVLAFRDRPWQGFLGVWFFAILTPSSTLVPLLIQPAAEKRMYLPLAAVIVAVVICTYGLGRRLASRLGPHLGTIVGQLAGVGLTAAAVLILGFLTVRRNCDYRSELAIWQDTVDKLPHSYHAWNSRGAAYQDVGDYDQAIHDYTQALRLNPQFAQTYRNRGLARSKKGRYDQAIEDYTHAIKLKGNYAEAYNSRAVAHYHKHQYARARADARRAQALGYKVAPGFLEALRKAPHDNYRPTKKHSSAGTPPLGAAALR